MLKRHESFGVLLNQVMHITPDSGFAHFKTFLPKINKTKIKTEEKLDGKYLLRTSDDTLSPEDVALGYKQLLEVEDAFRTLKTTLELRPVYHRLEDRIRSHVLLCWLALLLIRCAENKTKDTWRNMRDKLQRMLWVNSSPVPGGFCKGRKQQRL